MAAALPVTKEVTGHGIDFAGRSQRVPPGGYGEKWEAVSSDTEDASLLPIRETMKVAILYALGYLFEHREEADHHDLVLTLRSILFAIREGVV